VKTIELIIQPDGQARLETHGFTGAGCRNAALFLRQALGAVTRETLTADYYAQSPLTNTITHGKEPHAGSPAP
jgi:hypothetical protein